MSKKRWLYAAVLGSASLFLAACAKRIPQRCVDQDGRVVEDHVCEDDERNGLGQPGYIYRYHWYWGGPSSYVPVGTMVRGGTYEPPASDAEVFSPRSSGAQRTGVAMSPETAAERGLFGASAGAHGEGEGEGGAHAGE